MNFKINNIGINQNNCIVFSGEISLEESLREHPLGGYRIYIKRYNEDNSAFITLPVVVTGQSNCSLEISAEVKNVDPHLKTTVCVEWEDNALEKRINWLQNPVKVAIIGCCVTRDNFTTRFTPDYKDFFECTQYSGQTSIISVMSRATDFSVENTIKFDGNADKELLKLEVEKTYLESLNQQQPDYLILDFWADVHFGVFRVKDNQYITNNEFKFNNTEFKKELESFELIKLSENTEKYFRLWKKSLGSLFAYLNKNLPKTKVVINKERNAKYFYNKSNEKVELCKDIRSIKIDVEYYNQLWDMLDEYAIRTYDVDYVDLTSKEYFSYEGHPWRGFYVHYTKEFYEDFIFEFKRLVHRDIFENLKD